MRLICPNCAAEYLVDDAAIPDEGRDVQCSNCGHAWFQLHAAAEMARVAEDEVFGKAPVDKVQPEDTDADDTPDTVLESGDQRGAGLAEAVAATAATRQTLAESVLSVLREEAERETTVRRETEFANVAGNVEMQPDLGLEDASQKSAASRHIARLKGAEPEFVTEAEPKSAARRDLLPDIEEINSTLRANADRAKENDAEIDALPDLVAKRGGFRAGFVLMMVTALVLFMAYVMAPRIIAQIPGSTHTMRAYVGTVDAGRLWLDGAMKSVSGSLRNLTSEDK